MTSHNHIKLPAYCQRHMQILGQGPTESLEEERGLAVHKLEKVGVGSEIKPDAQQTCHRERRREEPEEMLMVEAASGEKNEPPQERIGARPLREERRIMRYKPEPNQKSDSSRSSVSWKWTIRRRSSWLTAGSSTSRLTANLSEYWAARGSLQRHYSS